MISINSHRRHHGQMKAPGEDTQKVAKDNNRPDLMLKYAISLPTTGIPTDYPKPSDSELPVAVALYGINIPPHDDGKPDPDPIMMPEYGISLPPDPDPVIMPEYAVSLPPDPVITPMYGVIVPPDDGIEDPPDMNKLLQLMNQLLTMIIALLSKMKIG